MSAIHFLGGQAIDVAGKDRADAVDPGQRPVLDRELPGRFPEGYRHLAYFQSRLGRTVATDLPGAGGDALQRLLERGAAWLAGTNVFAHA